MDSRYPWKRGLYPGALGLLALALAACGSAATPTPVPPTAAPVSATVSATQPPAATAANTAAAPTATRATMATPTAMPTATTAPEHPVSAKSKAIAVVANEPAHLNAVPTSDAHAGIIMDTLGPYLGHLDKDTLEVKPSPFFTSWERAAPDTWVYHLRPDVVFHDGEPWHAENWKLYATFAGVPTYNSSGYNHTGGYTVEVIDPMTARIKCESACPLFERGLNLARMISPKVLREIEFNNIRNNVGAGPYMQVEWTPGQKIRTVAYDKFASPPETPELAPPILEEIEWQWREETTVRAAMIMANEADWAFLLTLDDANILGPERFVTGGTSETAMARMDTVFDPWLSQAKMRLAIVHSIDCQSIVDNIYKGTTDCRGNVAAPGVLGITPQNIAPYEFDPERSKGLLNEIGYICGEPGAKENCGAPISIMSRSARISNNTELIESVVAYMKAVGINAEANFVEVGIRGASATCGVGSEGAQIKGWKGATENKKPNCPYVQAVEHIGFGYELFDYGKVVVRHLNCDSTQSSVCLPDKQEEWQAAIGLEGEERRRALEAIATQVHDEAYFIPMFDLSAIYGVNPKLRGFEEPRFDKHLFANLWRFAE